MTQDADTRYGYSRPWESSEERLTTASLAYATIPANQIRAIRPVVPRS
jgi:hypothetical protein